MVLDRLSRRIETARALATQLQGQAGVLDPAAAAALDQAVERLQAALEEFQAGEEQVRDQQDALLAARATIDVERELYHQIFRSTSNAYLVTNPAGIIREANDAAADLLGAPAPYLVDKPLAIFVDPTALAPFYGDLKIVRESNVTAHEFVVQLRPRNGPGLLVNATVASVRSLSGDLESLRWLVHGSAASEHLRHVVEAEVVRLRTLLDALPDGVLVHELDGRIILVNTQVVDLFGYSHEELIGQLAEMLLPERFRAGHIEHRAAYATAPRTRPMGLGLELLGRRKDGSEFPVDVSLGVVEVAGRVQLISTVRDVTERRLLEETRAHLATIVQTATDAIIGKTIEGIVTSWNPGAERLFGYTAAEMVGQPLARLAPPEARDEYQAALSLARRGFRVPPFDTIRIHKDGRRLDVNVSFSPIVGSDGVVIGISVVVQDIAERRALEHLRDEIQALTSRELRSPLSAIRSYAELGMRRHPVDASTVRAIVDQSEHLERLIGDLTDDALIEAGHVELQTRTVDLRALVRRCAERFRDRTGGRTVQIEAPNERVIGRWDRSRLDQVLDDLFDVSSWQGPGGDRLMVQIADLGQMVQVTVTIPGVEMRPAQLQSLFDRLPRLPGSGRTRGAPLSLWIARALVEAHGGQLRAEAPDRRGVVFVLSLPYAPPLVGGSPPSHLTRRQLEVVALIAEGKSNREIAAELTLTQTAVENHVGRILRRLGLHNRTAVASWAIERGLARGSTRNLGR